MHPRALSLAIPGLLFVSACGSSTDPSSLPPVVNARRIAADSLEVIVAVPRGDVAWSVSTCPIIGEERRGTTWTASDRIGTQDVQCPFPLLVVQPGASVRTTVPVAAAVVPAEGYRVGVSVEPVIEGASAPSFQKVYSGAFELPVL